MTVEIDPKEKRRRLKAFWAEWHRVEVLRRQLRFTDAAQRTVLPSYPEFPRWCEDMTCGAKAKSTGAPCKSKEIHRNGRCKFHGGLSTGPKSASGKLVALGNLKQFAEPHGVAEKS